VTVHLAPVWVVLRCGGGCRQQFTANARTVPQWSGKPYCESCFARANRVRALLDLPTYDVPPGTYPEPDPVD
jgi:hypothetical protein